MKIYTGKYLTIWSRGLYRIVEFVDNYSSINSLMGDCFDPKENPDIDPVTLGKLKQDFIRLVHAEGVYGYELEKWNGKVGIGWESEDSCCGVVGRYESSNEKYNHYIVNEMIGKAKANKCK